MEADQVLARQAVGKAIRDGRLRPEPCVVCWGLPSVAHHPRGYDAEHRLDIVWLCAGCHERIHGRALEPAGSDLREERQRSGLSLRQLEAATGINRGRLSILERGVRPTGDEAGRILRALALAMSRCSVCGKPNPAASLDASGRCVECQP